jgi:predicted SAM-dependent methyltransferase
MKLNLGCGDSKFAGYCNVDKYGEPDLRWDLETFPWPWADNSVEEVAMSHSLEHIGQSADTFIAVIKELYRVCRDQARLVLRVPHPRHDNFLNDPTHVRAITPELFQLFSKKKNLEWRKQGCANTPLALHHQVDFELVSVKYALDEPYLSDLKSGKLKVAEVDRLIRTFNNVAHEIEIIAKVVK